VIFPLKTGTLEAVATFDAVVVLFLWVEYLFRVNKQDDKWRYVAYQWSDILAIIPFDYIALVSFGIALPLTIAFKLLRLVRIVALLRFSRRIEREVFAFAEKTRLIYGLAVYLLVIIVGSLLFSSIETPATSLPAFIVTFRVSTFCFDAAGRFTRSSRRSAARMIVTAE
jgi:hypothetical protein